jgi:hypothetical protein
MKIDLAVQRRDGSELCRYQVEQVTIEAERASHISAQLAHHVILIDRSSSMAEVMPELLHRLRKLLILEEYQDAQIKVSLLSYASQGDLITHCERAIQMASRTTLATALSEREETGMFLLIGEDSFLSITVEER